MKSHFLVLIGVFVALIEAAHAEECVTVETTVEGNSLEGQLWPDQEITVLGWGCGSPERYDYIVFEVENKKEQVIKQVWGLPGDELKLLDKGKFSVNGVEAKTPFGRPYVLLGYAKTRFKKFEGKLTGYLVLGHPGSVDSTRVGLIKKWDIFGYVPKEQAQKTAN